MAERRIFSVGLSLPGEEFEFIEFDSDQTLLDADIILFEPTLGDCGYAYGEQHNGKSILSEHSSFATKKQLDHWRSEIVAAVAAGKLVIVYLVKPVEACRYTGERQFSGTGRSRVTTRIVADVSSYDAIPNVKRVAAKSGRSIRLEKAAPFLAAYWSEFSAISPYMIEVQGEFDQVLLRSSTGDRVVGAAVQRKGGTLLLLPPLQYDTDKFEREVEEEDGTTLDWTEEAYQFGKRLVSALVGMEGALKQSRQATAPPTWTTDSKYRLAEETEFEAAIEACNAELAVLQTKRLGLEEALEDAGTVRCLLFEQGKPLEAAILQAMNLFGFQARALDDGTSEFDAILTCPEGRCLGEAEGKDKKPINIDKFSQLERNLQEDFARDGVEEHAKGILFGNAHRLLPMSERGEFFTAKCIAAAKRIGAALVRTPDLFEPARYLKEHPEDLAYASKCRAAIMSTEGEVVAFPPVPTSDLSPVEATANAG
jgi:hypothetical protein